jgi:hypothetical protein
MVLMDLLQMPVMDGLDGLGAVKGKRRRLLAQSLGGEGASRQVVLSPSASSDDGEEETQQIMRSAGRHRRLPAQGLLPAGRSSGSSCSECSSCSEWVCSADMSARMFPICFVASAWRRFFHRQVLSTLSNTQRPFQLFGHGHDRLSWTIPRLAAHHSTRRDATRRDDTCYSGCLTVFMA